MTAAHCEKYWHGLGNNCIWGLIECSMAMKAVLQQFVELKLK